MTVPDVPDQGPRPAQGLSTPLPTTNRPKGYAALAVMLIVGLATLGYWFYARAGATVPVLVAARDIPAGQVITRADLGVTSVSGGVTAVGANHLAEVVGRTASVEILPRTPVQVAMVTARSTLSASQALVGVAEAPGQIPSAGLLPGDEVEVVRLPSRTSAVASVGSPVLAVATVEDVRANPAVEGGTLLTLLVARTAVYPITAASDGGLVALVTVSTPR